MGKKPKQKGVVDFSDTFLLYYSERFSDKTLTNIDSFIEHVEANGVRGWKGKVSPSDRVPEQAKNRQRIIEHAKEHKLWHAHIGEPTFKDSYYGNYKVSDWVLHFQYFNNYEIKLLELGQHNPMILPEIL